MNASSDAASAKPRKSFFSKLGSIASKGKYLFSFIGLVLVASWAFCEIMGWHPEGLLDGICVMVIFTLALFELAKTNNADQMTKSAFMTDLVTGTLEFGCFCVVVTILAMKGQLQYGQLTNWAMLLFTLCDLILVARNRYSLVYRQVNVGDARGDSHGHSGATAASAEHFS